jgi:putative Mg2+ transporter-C (MgtC) family protein
LPRSGQCACLQLAMLGWTEVILRLGIAALVGAAIGLDRDLHGKPTGVRTMGIVALGSALIVLASQYPAQITDQAAASRVMQGIITGIGFLGAGVILRNPGHKRVHGLTTAASIWLTACIGAACGAGAWPLVLIAAILVGLIFSFGRPLERALERYYGSPGQEHDQSDEG